MESKDIIISRLFINLNLVSNLKFYKSKDRLANAPSALNELL